MSSQQTNRQISHQISHQISQRPTLAQITAALDALRDAARAGDRAQYLTARDNALAMGCIEDQIHDAYRWGARQRMTLDTHSSGVIDFDWQGH